MERVRADKAVSEIPAGARVVLPQGCIEPWSVFDAIAASRGDPANPTRLYSGLQFGRYRFLGDLDATDHETGGLGPGYRYVTWQVGGAIRRIARSGRIGFLPLRFGDIPRLFGRGGFLSAEVAVIQCTPPRAGRVSLGSACAIYPAMVEAAKLVIAEIHPDMPWSDGTTEIPVDAIDFAVDATGPLGTLPRASCDDIDRAIVDHVLELIPDDAWVQLGVGTIPEAVLLALSERSGINLHSGMYSDPLLEFLDRQPNAKVVTGEVSGSVEMYRQAVADPRVSLQPTTVTHSLPYLAGIERFVSINSAIEVDLTGQVNGATIGGHCVSGVGGSLDFVEGARYSPGGFSVVAMRSKAKAHSRIVPRLPEGNAVSLPNFTVDFVVTEQGVARLTGCDLEERAAALRAIAAPEMRAGL
ncbi:MAG: acetyl-CoA hydrolase/transferase C-terminal domain-containing protein [Candidatus Binatia bacterium]|nr:acetyl-CoA hydrolase/transferase C-terminal domain-containing protein [Candidatus Binatia bacterium]